MILIDKSGLKTVSGTMRRLVYTADKFFSLIDDSISTTWTKQTVEEFESEELALKRIDELGLKIIDDMIVKMNDEEK